MTVPTVCPHCGAPVKRERDRGVWRVYQCTACPWGDAIRKGKR